MFKTENFGKVTQNYHNISKLSFFNFNHSYIYPFLQSTFLQFLQEYQKTLFQLEFPADEVGKEG